MNNTSPFNIGDLVKLKSGGPKMTVQEVVDAGKVRCQWFAGAVLQSGLFPNLSVDHAVNHEDEE